MKTDEGSTKEEASESPDEEKEEDSGAGVVIPEDFQTDVAELLSDAAKPMLAFVRDAVYNREEELRKAEMTKGKKKGSKNVPTTFSSADMPSD